MKAEPIYFFLLLQFQTFLPAIARDHWEWNYSDEYDNNQNLAITEEVEDTMNVTNADLCGKSVTKKQNLPKEFEYTSAFLSPPIVNVRLNSS